MDREEWKTVPGFSKYEVSNQGNVRSLYFTNRNVSYKREKALVLKFGMNDGYKHLALCKNGVRKIKRVNRLVLEVFAGPCPEGMCGCHNDGNRANNHIDNLRWDTYKNNSLDVIKHGNTTKGSQNKRSKLNENDVANIRTDIKNGVKQKVLAKRYSVSTSSINYIAQRKTWKHVA
jgi:hypothetical protein